MSQYMVTGIVRGMVLAAFIMTAPVSEAVTRDGVEMPDTADIKGDTLVLNGTGTRKATVFSVKVYVMGLYLETRSDDPEEIINMAGDKRILMTFIRDVARKKLVKAWEKGFGNNYPGHMEIRAEIDMFMSAMRDVKKGESIVIDMTGQLTRVSLNEAEEVSIKGREFQKALLSVWLGPSPPNEELKEGILGGSAM